MQKSRWNDWKNPRIRDFGGIMSLTTVRDDNHKVSSTQLSNCKLNKEQNTNEHGKVDREKPTGPLNKRSGLYVKVEAERL